MAGFSPSFCLRRTNEKRQCPSATSGDTTLRGYGAEQMPGSNHWLPRGASD